MYMFDQGRILDESEVSIQLSATLCSYPSNLKKPLYQKGCLLFGSAESYPILYIVNKYLFIHLTVLLLKFYLHYSKYTQFLRLLYNSHQPYQWQPIGNQPVYNSYNTYNACSAYQCPYYANTLGYRSDSMNIQLKDYGPQPFVVNIEDVTKQNSNFRTALWTGCHLQLTLMSIPVGGEIGLENHPNLDQFIRIEEGQDLVQIGDRKDYLNFQERVYDDYTFIIPAGKWHNLINTGISQLNYILFMLHLSIHVVQFTLLKQMQRLLNITETSSFKDINKICSTKTAFYDKIQVS